MIVVSGATIGIGIQVEPTANQNGLYDAKVTVSIISESLSAEETFPIRARFEEVQRRSGMIAADVLHRALRSERAD
jgi:hypothetical protein